MRLIVAQIPNPGRSCEGIHHLGEARNERRTPKGSDRRPLHSMTSTPLQPAAAHTSGGRRLLATQWRGGERRSAAPRSSAYVDWAGLVGDGSSRAALWKTGADGPTTAQAGKGRCVWRVRDGVIRNESLHGALESWLSSSLAFFGRSSVSFL